jgi:muramidase (phage lysozyme)
MPADVSPNLGAFLWVIRHCEGTAGLDGYRTLYGGGLFNSFADHPNVAVTAGGYTSTAAGAYQILYRTWGDFIASQGPHDFSPDSQDLCARWLISRRGAMADVEAGRLEAAIAKCNKEWASLPGSPYGQPTRDMAYCRAKFRQAGGQEVTPLDSRVTIAPTQAPGGIAAQPDTPPPEQSGAPAPDVPSTVHEPHERTRMDPLSIISLLTGVFSPLIRAKVDKALGSEVGKPLVDNLLAVTQQVTGKADPLEAVAVARQNPEMVAKVEVAADDWFKQAAPFLDKLAEYDAQKWGAEIAGKRAASEVAIAERRAGLWDMTQTVVWFAAATLSGLVFALLGALLYQATTGERTIDSGLLGLAGPIFMSAVAAWAAIIAFRFDGTKSSEAQSAALSAMVARK